MIFGIRVPDREPGEVLHVGDESAGVVDRVVDLEAERLPELVVLLAVTGRDVDEAGALVHPDEVRGGDRALAIDPRMAEPASDRASRRARSAEHGVLAVRRTDGRKSSMQRAAPRRRPRAARRARRSPARDGPRSRGWPAGSTASSSRSPRTRSRPPSTDWSSGGRGRQRKLHPHRRACAGPRTRPRPARARSGSACTSGRA